MSRLGIFFCVVSNSSVINHRRRCGFFVLLIYTVILNWCSSMTKFVSWRLCLIAFKTFSDRSWIRTNAHTRVPEFSTEVFLQPGSLDRSAILPCFRRHVFFSFDLRPFHWVIFSIQRCNLLNGLCHPYEKICVQTLEYFRVSHVSAGYLLFCALENRSAVGHRWCCHFFVFFLLWTVIFN